MRVETPAEQPRSLDETDVNTVVSRAERLPHTLEGVIEPEEAAGPARAEQTGLTAWLFREESEPRQVPMAELPELAADDESFVWVDLAGYEPQDLEAVAGQLELPAAGVRLALAGWNPPRLGVFDECFVAAVTVPHNDLDARRVLASELDLFVGRNYLVSAHKRPLPFAERALARAVQNPDLLKLDSAFLLSILVDELLAHYDDLTEELEDEIETMEERALTDASDAFLEDLLQLKRVVFAIHRLAGQHRPVLEAFLRPDFPLVGGDTIEPYFRDLHERLGRLLDALDAAKDGVNGAFDLYVSRVAHRTNDIMKVLTVVSVTLLPATVILGFFGTSFESPRFNTDSWFILMVALVVLTTAGSLVLFTRRGWVRGTGRKP
jgi:magnesium transporter